MALFSRTGDESRATLLQVIRLSTAIDVNQQQFNIEVELLLDQANVNDITHTCWKLFIMNRNVVTSGILLLIYYTFITIQMNTLIHKQN